MNGLLHERLAEHLGPHECSPHNGACDLPHYRFNFTLPTYMERWPRRSLASQKREQVREQRELQEALRD